MKPTFYQLDFITAEVTLVELRCSHNSFPMERWDYRQALTGYEMVYRSYDECVVRELQCLILWDRQQGLGSSRGKAEREWERAMQTKRNQQ